MILRNLYACANIFCANCTCTTSVLHKFLLRKLYTASKRPLKRAFQRHHMLPKFSDIKRTGLAVEVEAVEVVVEVAVVATCDEEET